MGGGAPDPASVPRAGGGRRGEPGALAALWRFGRNTSAGPGAVEGAGGGGDGEDAGAGVGVGVGGGAVAGAGSGEGAAERIRRSFAIFYFTW